MGTIFVQFDYTYTVAAPLEYCRPATGTRLKPPSAWESRDGFIPRTRPPSGQGAVQVCGLSALQCLRPDAPRGASHSLHSAARTRSQSQRRIHRPRLPTSSPRSAPLRGRDLMVVVPRVQLCGTGVTACRSAVRDPRVTVALTCGLIDFCLLPCASNTLSRHAAISASLRRQGAITKLKRERFVEIAVVSCVLLASSYEVWVGRQ